MSTATALSPAQISARRQAAAVAELQRNGISVPKDREQFVPLPPEPLAQLPAERAEVHSPPDARPMAPDDVANVRRLSSEEESAFMRRLRLTSPRLHASLLEATDELWDAWPDSDVRWTLTPHQARKLNPMRTVKAK